jgi:8-oxo-dGTP diphosphatase
MIRRMEVTTMRITAGGVLVREGEVLLARRRADRKYYGGVWDIIGGHCRPGELPEAALRREMHEELGIEVLAAREIGAFAEPDPARYGPGRHYVFVVTKWRGVPVNACPEEHDEIGWFGSDDLPQLLLASPGYAELLQQIISAGANR